MSHNFVPESKGFFFNGTLAQVRESSFFSGEPAKIKLTTVVFILLQSCFGF